MLKGTPLSTRVGYRFSVLVPSATLDRGAADGGKRLPRQPHVRSDGGAARDAGEEDGSERGIQRQLDRPHGQPDEGGHARRGGHSPVTLPPCPACTPDPLKTCSMGRHRLARPPQTC